MTLDELKLRVKTIMKKEEIPTVKIYNNGTWEEQELYYFYEGEIFLFYTCDKLNRVYPLSKFNYGQTWVVE